MLTAKEYLKQKRELSDNAVETKKTTIDNKTIVELLQEYHFLKVQEVSNYKDSMRKQSAYQSVIKCQHPEQYVILKSKDFKCDVCGRFAVKTSPLILRTIPKVKLSLDELVLCVPHAKQLRHNTLARVVNGYILEADDETAKELIVGFIVRFKGLIKYNQKEGVFEDI